MMLVIPKGYEKAAPGAMPPAKLVEAMTKYNQELTKAGVLLTLDGLHPPSMGARVVFSSFWRFPGKVMPGGGTAPLLSIAGVAGALEMVGGALLLVGLFTRPVAFLLSGEMAVAYFMGHAVRGFWPVLNQGSPAILFCFLWLYFSTAGAGPWSIDALLRRPGRVDFAP